MAPRLTENALAGLQLVEVVLSEAEGEEGEWILSVGHLSWHLTIFNSQKGVGAMPAGQC